ncbi:MAG: MmgE/PrpD family protein, partial [Eubacterium sp.]
MIHATEILSKFVADLKYDDLPDEAIETTKMYITDYYAACFAGMKINKKFNKAVEEMLFDMGGKSEASVLLSNEKLPVSNAAYLNAVYAHGADMDDGNRKAMGHVGAHVMSTAFAMAEIIDTTGRELLTAINCGYEIYNRVAAAVQPGLVHRGFHSTGTAGAIACAATAAKLMKLDSKGIYNSMALASIQASGLIIIAESGQACKPINPANAARTGIVSATLAAKGIDSCVYPLESKKGWFHAMSDEVNESMITDGLGEKFTICESYLKPYPSCRHTHCGIECVLNIRKRIIEDFKAINEKDIEAIDVSIYKNAIQIAGQIILPKTSDDSKFSIHYSLATALLKGKFTLDCLSIDNVDDDIRSLVKKITLIEDQSLEHTEKGIRGSRATVRLTGKKEYTYEVLIPKGDAANPFSWEDMREKLYACTHGILTEKQCSGILDFIGKIELIDNFKSI